MTKNQERRLFMNNIKILVVEPKKEPYIKEIKNTIGEIYGIVYFPFEILEIEKDIILISSLGGKDIKDKFFPANRIFKDSIIYSSFVILGKKNSGFSSLTNEQVRKYTDMFSLTKDLEMHI